MSLPNANSSSLILQPTSSGAPEYAIPLWWYSGGWAPVTTTSYVLASRGSTSFTATTSATSSNKLYTLANFPNGTKFAYEVCILPGTSGLTAYSALWDFTTGAIVSGSEVSSTTTTATIIRSGQISLISGRQYGVVVKGSSTANGVSITDASLIVFSS